MNSIMKRKSIRRYTKEKIREEDIKKLLRAGMQAPSAGNQQPWRYTVVTNEKIIKKLSDFSPYASFIKEAPLVIIISIANDNIKYPELAPIDAAISAENMLLEAVECGFGGVYLAIYPEQERMEYVSELLELEDTPIVALSFGYAKKEEEIEERYDKKKVTYIR